MAVWFLANATANYLAGFMSSLYPETGKANPQVLGFEITSLYDFFMVFVVSAAIASLLLFLISGRLVRVMNTRD
jgi:POT family proton-dependent oligopeptide transporter